MTEHPLLPAVEAVPDAIAEVGTWPVGRRIADAEQHADTIGTGAEVLFVTDPKKVRRAEVQPQRVREAVTYGLAILAHRPGGVGFGGLHWCAIGHRDPGAEPERRADAPCPGPGEWTLTAGGTSAAARGAVFTPRELAEEVTVGGLEPLVYLPGPLETADRGEWRLRSSADILALHVGDMCVGSGVFLLTACRYLATRLVEAWHAEAGQPAPDRLPPHHPMSMAARRLTMRCLRAVDIDPTSVELARLAVALLAPTVPVDLTAWIVTGDALLGITSLEQLRNLSLRPGRAPVGPVVDAEELRLLMRLEAHRAKARL